MYYITKAGLAMIEEILTEHHKRGPKFLDAEISAWASEIEDSLDEQGPDGAYLEIKAADAISGHTETHKIFLTGYDWKADE